MQESESCRIDVTLTVFKDDKVTPRQDENDCVKTCSSSDNSRGIPATFDTL